MNSKFKINASLFSKSNNNSFAKTGTDFFSRKTFNNKNFDNKNFNKTCFPTNNNNPEKESNLNGYYTNTNLLCYQSPKISNGKKRNFSAILKPKLFSLRDVNDKITDSHGTTIPKQFSRINDKELKKMFYVPEYKKKFWLNLQNKPFNNTNNNNNNLNIIPSIDNYIKTENDINNQITKNNEQNDKNINNNLNINKEKDKETIDKTYCQTTQNELPIKIKNNILLDNNNKKENKPDKKPILLFSSKKDINNLRNQNSLSARDNNSNLSKINNNIGKSKRHTRNKSDHNDIWMPKGYTYIEEMLLNPEYRRKELIVNNPFANKLPQYTLREIKDKNWNSDIFLLKNKNNNNYYSNTEGNKINRKINPYNESDIFYLKNDLISIEKSGENCLFRPQKKEVYNISKLSNSQWAPKSSVPTLLNHTSVNWNLLNPGIKSNSKTKEEIQNNNLNFNPIYRQKSISEFIDLSNVGSNNCLKAFNEAYTKSKDCFRKRSDLCSDYNDIHLSYKNICDKPFAKPKQIY